MTYNGEFGLLNLLSNYSSAGQWSPVNMPRLQSWMLKNVLLTNTQSRRFNFLMYWILVRSYGVDLLIQNDPGKRPNFSQIV